MYGRLSRGSYQAASKGGTSAPEPFVWEVLSQMAYGLRDLHRLYKQTERKVLIRLRPSSVLFTNAGRLKLGDLSPCSLSHSLPMRVTSSLPPELFEDKESASWSQTAVTDLHLVQIYGHWAAYFLSCVRFNQLRH